VNVNQNKKIQVKSMDNRLFTIFFLYLINFFLYSSTVLTGMSVVENVVVNLNVFFLVIPKI